MTKRTVEETYQKLTQKEHVLKRPGMYIGSIDKTMEELWVKSDDSEVITKNMVEYTPGFIKIFDEVLTNALDHSSRDPTLTYIKVDYSKETGEITVLNNGTGIPVVLHKEHNLYVPELIFGHLLSGSNYDDRQQRTGAGQNGIGIKCILHTTNVPLFNGLTKQAKDIQIGDVLIGDDGNQRTVLNKYEGYGEMYKVSQHLGDDYIVNKEHILTLHMPDHKVIFWNYNGWCMLWWDNENKIIRSKFLKVFDMKRKCLECDLELSSSMKRHYKRKHTTKKYEKPRNPPTYGNLSNPIVLEKYNEMKKFAETIIQDSIFDISIGDFLQLNTTTQRRLAGVRGNCVNWKESTVKLDPYILGLWLGDGMKCGRSYACYGEKDTELIDYLKSWGEQNDASINQTSYNKYQFNIQSISRKGKYNSSPLRNLLKLYNLIDNKHIPKEYLINSKDIRLNVLAGIIDTDGTLSRDGTRIVITQSHKHKRLFDDIVFLARSLGFCCHVKSFMSNYKTRNGETRSSLTYSINITGNIQSIPTKLPRKKCNNTKSINTDKSTGYISIEKVPDDHYIGFQIDGNQRFIINDFTVTHNCSNIYSKRFVVETVDSDNKLKFVQEFTDNMTNRSTPKITKCSVKSYTKITFLPDYTRFHMTHLEDDTISIINKRVYDCIACTRDNVQIYLNGEKLRGKGLQDYTNYFFPKKNVDGSIDSVRMYHEKIVDRDLIWEFVVVPSERFEHVSFVNGNSTYQGGKHVDHIVYQIINRLKTLLETKKRIKDVKPAFIKERLFLFLRATVINPSFSSQTKEVLTTQVKDFGCRIEVPDKFIERLWKSSIIEDVVEFCKMKESLDVAKKTDGVKRNKIYIPKLEDALWAGTAKSDQCTLILTEGLSAMTFALWGRSIVGPDRWGVFPLRGKALNIRDANASQLINNEEINNLKQILGLKHGKDYKDTKELRYGKVMLLTDSDVDGSHIKGLLINLFHYWWPNLLKMDFLQTLRTPILKAIRGQKTLEFYTEQDYRKWQSTVDTRGYQIKYFKGLGTSKKEDAQQAFRDMDRLRASYYYKDSVCDDSIELAFEKDKNTNRGTVASETVGGTTEIETTSAVDTKLKCSDRRKRWLAKYDKNSYIDAKTNRISYQDFVHKELIHFSIYDNLRSIPSLCDGLKPSQRKILHYMLKNSVTKSIKVAQLSGYVSAETGYHHGEVSLQGAITNMAQNFVGSNNINLLFPDGNFGSRLNAGKDAASPRYIFTKLCNVTQQIFDKRDSALLRYLNDDGMDIEPEWFIPIIPMVLVNGCEGIGTGYSTSIPPYNPRDIISNLLRILNDPTTTPLPMTPYYRGFRGQLKETEPGSYVTLGKWEKITDTQIRITELPVGVAVTPYKEFLESMIESNAMKAKAKKDATEGTKRTKRMTLQLKDVQNKTRDENTEICFIVEFCRADDLTNLIKTGNLEKTLKLSRTINTNNMYLFSEDLILTKYSSVTDILLDFYDIRIEFYGLRKQYIIQQLTNDLVVLNAKIRFINEYINGDLDINRKNREYIINLLKRREYPMISATNSRTDSNDSDDTGSYDYLIRMQLISLSSEKITELESERDRKQLELDTIRSKTERDLWREDLENLLKNTELN